MTRRLGAWDCSYCSHKKILGNIFDCPGCGHPRPRGVRFYQIPDGPIVTPAIAKQLGSGGPNWYCEHCDSGNRDNEDKCMDCGAPKGSSPSHKVTKYRQGEHVPQSTEEAEQSDPGGKSWVEPVVATSGTGSSKPSRRESYSASNSRGFINSVKDLLPVDFDNSQFMPYVIGVATVAALILTLSLVYQIFFKTHTETVQVRSYNWSQTLTVQEYQIVHESSWSTYPSGAYNIVSDYRDTGRDEKIHDGWDTEEYTTRVTRLSRLQTLVLALSMFLKHVLVHKTMATVHLTPIHTNVAEVNRTHILVPIPVRSRIRASKLVMLKFIITKTSTTGIMFMTLIDGLRSTNTPPKAQITNLTITIVLF